MKSTTLTNDLTKRITSITFEPITFEEERFLAAVTNVLLHGGKLTATPNQDTTPYGKMAAPRKLVYEWTTEGETLDETDK